MEWLCNVRAARLAAAIFAAVAIGGCSELNQWSGPSPDPFFSVPDPTPEEWVAEHDARQAQASSADDATDD